jgi:8-amino-7-oxononanoate synthase
MRPLLDHLRGELAALRTDHLERRLALPQGLDFTSNDYLGLANHPEMRRRVLRRLEEGSDSITAPSSRLLRGHTQHHQDLEAKLASFKGTEAALLFPSGYQANLGLLTALVGRRDRVLSDEFNHASLIDGLRLTRCHKEIFPHCDAAAVEQALAQPFPGGRTFLLTESLFSMEGSLAPLDRYAELADHHGAELIVDDAHATGLYGERGAGLVEECGVTDRVLAVMSTAGKALGVAGAFVTGSQTLIDYLVNRSRPFVFTTAPPPLLLTALETALDLAQEQPRLRRNSLRRASQLRDRLRALGFEIADHRSPIVPVVLGDNERALAVAQRLQKQGFDVRAVRPPTVPRGTARLRLSVHADHSVGEIDRLASAIAEARAAPDLHKPLKPPRQRDEKQAMRTKR